MVRSFIDGFVDADPAIVGIVLGALTIFAVVFVVLRLRRGARGSGG